jgi:hypothetical protein
VDGKHLCYWLLPGQDLPDSVPPRLSRPIWNRGWRLCVRSTPHPRRSMTSNLRRSAFPFPG